MSKPIVHELTGLKPDALATYLIALGMFRIFGEQKDPCARGFWRDEHFVVVSEFDWNAVERFFVEEYEPTPILAPWNLESGFYDLKSSSTGAGQSDDGGAEGSNEDEDVSADALLDSFARSAAPRFARFRQAVQIAFDCVPDELQRAEEAARTAFNEMLRQEAGLKATLEGESGYREALGKVKEAEAALDACKRIEDKAEKRSQVQAASAQVKEARAQLTRESRKIAQRVKSDAKALRAPLAEAKKAFKEVQASAKAKLIAELRARWNDEPRQWVDSAIGISVSAELEYAPLFGSGGNDGRMEFTRNFRRHIDELFDIRDGAPRERTEARLCSLAFGAPARLLLTESVGQFFPGRAGGTNMAGGYSGRPVVNPWEFVLMLEGAVALVSGMSRRGDVGAPRVASPFWVEGAAAGFGSGSGLEGLGRGEQWLPMWSGPLRYSELVELIREGRAQLGGTRASTATDLVRAAARLGLARGIDSLQRFAYLERNGQSNLAVYTGRFRVGLRSNQQLLDEVAPWIDQLARFARRSKQNNVPLSLGALAAKAQDALFAVCRRDAGPSDWRELLVILGEAELALLRSGKSLGRQPLPTLSAGWVAAVDDHRPNGTTVLRLALAMASQHEAASYADKLTGSVRQHFIPVADPDANRVRFSLDDKGRPKSDPEHVCMGRNLLTDAIALVRRRLIWVRSAGMGKQPSGLLPLSAAPKCEATLGEIGWWLRNDRFDQAILELVRPLLALNWEDVRKRGCAVRAMCSDEPDPVHALLRLAHLPFAIPTEEGEAKTEVTIRLDPESFRRLESGDLDGALRVSMRRLGASGLRPVFRLGVATRGMARRLAASLAFPISQWEAGRAARLVCKPYDAAAREEVISTAAE